MADASCSACHTPHQHGGFAFENYDAVGGWRDTDAGMPVDASGTFPFASGEVSFKNAVEFSKAIATSNEARECFTKQFLEYTLRRPVLDSEQGSIKAIADAFAASGYDLKELLVATTKTRAFTHRCLWPVRVSNEISHESAMNKWDIARRDLLKSLGIGAACLPILRSSSGLGAGGAAQALPAHPQQRGLHPRHVEAAGRAAGQRHLPRADQVARAVPERASPSSPTWTSRTTRSATTGRTSATASSTGVVPPARPSGKYHEPHGATLDQVVAKARRGPG